MPANVTMETIYRELLSLRKDVEAVKLALIPEEKVPEKELAELGQTRKEMESGKEKPFRAVFGK